MSTTVQIQRLLSLWLPPLALMGLIFFLSSQPNLSSGLGIWDFIGRKIIHMLEYGLLLVLSFRATRGRLLPAILIAAIYAVSDEIHQSYVPDRDGSPLDVLVDGAGVAFAALLLTHTDWGLKLSGVADNNEPSRGKS